MEGGDFVRDIISDLPDSLLAHILSFLPTEEAVCTCILSKRWMNVWISLPILVFDDHKCREDNLTKEEFQKRGDKFIRFLCGVISNREINSTLDTFKVTWWEEMSLWLHIYPREVQFIKLGSFNLPFLKKLELGYLNLNDDIMRMLISGCPILEELILINCALEGNMISSNVLKKLVLKQCFHYAPMEISCPAVVSLSIESVNTEGIALKNMLSLIMAEIYCHAVFLFDTLHYDMRLLGGLSNVTSLKLYTRSPDVMVFSILNFWFYRIKTFVYITGNIN
ncbi:putative F-box/LRR-repeat protein At3g18150 [Carex rostrata]